MTAQTTDRSKDHTICTGAAFASATTVLFASSLLFFVVALRNRLAATSPQEEDDDHITKSTTDPRFGLTFLICFVAFVSYYVMWFGHGHAQVQRQNGGGGVSYMTAWARYADWFITTPLLLLDLLWILGRSRPYDFASVLVLDVLMISLGLVAAFLVRSWPRYFMWALSTLAMLGVFASLLNFAYHPSEKNDDDNRVPDNEVIRFRKCLQIGRAHV